MARLLALTFVLFAAAACNAQDRIVGGEPTTIERYPSIAQVEAYDPFRGTWSQACGCNILNSRNVLTAAHCFEGDFYMPIFRRIRTGATYRNFGGLLYNVEREFNHPTYGLLEYDGDISVVRLSEPLIYSPVVQQARIIGQDAIVPDNLPVVHAGWGRTSYGGVSAERLQDVTIYTINNDICRERYSTLEPRPYTITTNMICAGVMDIGGRDACQGDSGGPLYYSDVIVGIVSFGHRCANETYPGVNTAVSSYTNWIVATAV